MQEIIITPGVAPEHIRALVCGLSGSGKTHFCATAERPVFLSDMSEGGHKTINFMDPQLWWDPAYVPKVLVIEQVADMFKQIGIWEQMVRDKTFPYRTIICDPLSTYTDRFLNELRVSGANKDPRQDYGDLYAHIRALMTRVHALPAHILWTAHLNFDGTEINGPAIGGKLLPIKVPAWCDYKFLCNVITDPMKPPSFELRTKPYKTWGFLGARSPMPEVVIPSMKCIYQLLGYKSQPVSPAVPGYPNGVLYQQA